MSNTLFTPANTKLLRLLKVSCPLDVRSISRALAMRPSLVRHHLWELQRLRIISHALPTSGGQSNQFDVELQHLREALAVAAQEMGAEDQ
ncbi:ArsR family transcriptional regulator [Arthrobacter sp. E3]|uniref:ArsR family transcriptional regulator n=1 Tax=Arthrobacter sp. E3 TaxID=517402 RepID=UPI001A945EBF|nr:ArsR family transcriptional regulator [Arthrobacter sp. E3]